MNQYAEFNNNRLPPRQLDHAINQPPRPHVGPTILIDCRQCGAGQTIPANADGYTCNVCENIATFRHCLRCNQSQIESICSNCGVPTPLAIGNTQAVHLRPATARFAPNEPLDPRQRIISGTVIAASSIPHVGARSECRVRFASDHVTVVTNSLSQVYLVATIAYSEVDHLKISGNGRQTTTTTTDAGLMGGGFGLVGAIKGIAMARTINALTRKSRTITTIDTIVDFKAGERQILLRNFLFDTAVFRVLLAPTYLRIQQSHSL